MVPEARLEQTDVGLVPASAGWFVMNARNGRWFEKPGQGHSLPLTGDDEQETEAFFPMLGMAIRVMGPGEPSGTYHWETEQVDFLVLTGEALLIVEGQERPLKQWDFVHCPSGDTARVRGRRRRAVRAALRKLPAVSERMAHGASIAPMRPPLATTRARPRTPRPPRSRMHGSASRGQSATARARCRIRRPSAR